MGFAGVLVILRPGSDGVNPALGYALLGAMLVAAIHLMLKRMVARDGTDTLVTWNLIATVPLAALPAYLVWTPPSLAMLGLLALQGVLGVVNMTLWTKSFSLADVSVVTPIEFLRLPFVAILAFAMFQEAVGLSTWVGGAVIFGATLVMAHSGRLRRSADPLNETVVVNDSGHRPDEERVT